VPDMHTELTDPGDLGSPGSRTSRPVIGASFDGRHNSLNFLRLALAVLVILSHGRVIGGYSSEFVFSKTTVGILAVYGFFGISGYLIAASVSRQPIGRYLWQRCLRIFPAFWVCLVVTAFGFGLYAWDRIHPCGFSCYIHSPNGPFSYIVHNSWLRLNQHGIAGTPSGVPLPGTWDGSLWTLFYEFLCYLILAVLAITTLLRHRLAVLVLAVAVWVAEIVITSVPSLNAQFNLFVNYDVSVMLALVPVFLAGSLLYLYRDRIPDSGILALACVGCILLSLVIPLGNHYPVLTLTSTNLFAPVLGYLMLWLGIHLPLQRVGSRNDYSYGVYIYAYPVSQLLALWGVVRWGYPAYVALIVLLTAPFAAASWWLVEKRALRLKHVTIPVRRREGARTHGTLLPSTEPLPSTLQTSTHVAD
jgi:peptidoglycan/LPS O-acetylase OafA/YrhL